MWRGGEKKNDLTSNAPTVYISTQTATQESHPPSRSLPLSVASLGPPCGLVCHSCSLLSAATHATRTWEIFTPPRPNIFPSRRGSGCSAPSRCLPFPASVESSASYLDSLSGLLLASLAPACGEEDKPSGPVQTDVSESLLRSVLYGLLILSSMAGRGRRRRRELLESEPAASSRPAQS